MPSSQRKQADETIIWTIANFNRILPRKRIEVESFIIHAQYVRTVWQFHLSARFNENDLTIYFKKAYPMFDPMLYDGRLSIQRSENKPEKGIEFRKKDFNVHNLKIEKDLRDFGEKLPISITIKCEISEVNEESTSLSEIADFENLSADLAAFLKKQQCSDLTVCIQQHKFHLHACILSARCPNLSYLFGYQNFKEMPNVIELNNFSPHLFRLLMEYLYSGKCEKKDFSLMLFQHADKIKLQSLKQMVYQKAQEHRLYTEFATLSITINWNLKEIQFQMEDSIPFVQVFHTPCSMPNLAVRMGISENSEGVKYIDVSFMIITNSICRSVSLLCVLTLFSNGEACGYKKGSHDITPGEEWHFPPFVKLSDIPEVNSPCFWLNAEVSFADGRAPYNIVHTKTLLTAQNDPVVYPERLSSDLRRLLLPFTAARLKEFDIYLKPLQGLCLYAPLGAHKPILWARWPAIREYPITNNHESHPCLELNLGEEEILLLLNYIYSGSLTILDSFVAQTVLKANEEIEFPQYLVKKCKDFLHKSSFPYSSTKINFVSLDF